MESVDQIAPIRPSVSVRLKVPDASKVVFKEGAWNKWFVLSRGSDPNTGGDGEGDHDDARL
jgi:hypothetical protein